MQPCSHIRTPHAGTARFPNQTGRQQHCDSLYTCISGELYTYQAPPFSQNKGVSVSSPGHLDSYTAFHRDSKNTPNMNTLWSFFARGNQINHDQDKDIQSENNNGFPVPNHTLSYWRSELHPIDSYCSSEELPLSCDIAIIGAGMTGVSTAYHLSRLHAANNAGKKPSIVILDAREVCSGATGRNGVCLSHF